MDTKQFQQHVLDNLKHWCGEDQSEWDWLLELDEAVPFDQLYYGPDMKSHIADKSSKNALCGAPCMAKRAPIVGEVWYCKKCLNAKQ
jgi:hypothetical protein